MFYGGDNYSDAGGSSIAVTGIFGWGDSGRDFGKWYCSNCNIIPAPNTDGGITGDSVGAFVTSVINPQIWGTRIPQWKTGDSFAICDGTNCIVYTYKVGAGTLSWTPKAPYPFRKDDGKGYKNPKGNETPVRVDPDHQSPPMPVANLSQIPGDVPVVTVYGLIQSNDHCCTNARVEVGPLVVVDPPPPPPPPSGGGGGGGGGGGCVHVNSRLPGGRRAGDVKVGDVIELGDEDSETLDTREGVVTYSRTVSARGFQVITQSGIRLLCSDTAPIWTDGGFVRAPDLLGKKVATRVDTRDGRSVTRFEAVEVLTEIGTIDVQHITVGDKAFWAGSEEGAYILHHNKMVIDE